MMNKRRLYSTFVQIKKGLSFCPCDIQQYIFHFVLMLTHINIKPNMRGFTIKTFNDVFVYDIGNYVLHSCFNTCIHIKNTSSLYLCVDKNIDTILTFATGCKYNCVYVLLKSGKFMISECCKDGTVWSDGTQDVDEETLVEMKINNKGRTSYFTHSDDACFVIIDNMLHLWGSVVGKIVIEPIQITLPNNEYPISIHCESCCTLILTNEGRAYKLCTQTLLLKKVNIRSKIRSIHCYQQVSFIITKNGVFNWNSHCERSPIKMKAPNNVIDICCTRNNIFFVTKNGKLFVNNMKNGASHLVKLDNVMSIKSDGNRVIIVTEYGMYHYVDTFGNLTSSVPCKIMDLTTLFVGCFL